MHLQDMMISGVLILSGTVGSPAVMVYPYCHLLSCLLHCGKGLDFVATSSPSICIEGIIHEIEI